MFLIFFSKTEAGHVLKMFLQFWLISASRSYKLGSYKKKNVYTQMPRMAAILSNFFSIHEQSWVVKIGQILANFGQF